jgi:hypothetical protein
MSSGQVPRRPEFFPRMKWRGRKRWWRNAITLAAGDYVFSGRDVARALVQRTLDSIDDPALIWPPRDGDA